MKLKISLIPENPELGKMTIHEITTQANEKLQPIIARLTDVACEFLGERLTMMMDQVDVRTCGRYWLPHVANLVYNESWWGVYQYVIAPNQPRITNIDERYKLHSTLSLSIKLPPDVPSPNQEVLRFTHITLVQIRDNGTEVELHREPIG